MRGGSILLLGLAAPALTNALVLEKRDSPAVLAVPVVKTRDVSNPRRISKRSDTVDVDFNSNVMSPFLYTDQWWLNFTLGTPPVTFEGYLDTLSNGLWVFEQYNIYCRNYTVCSDEAGYNSTKSSTSKELDEGFEYDYYGIPLEGTLVTDVLSIGDTKLKNMKFGVLEERNGWNNQTENNLGIGLGNASTSSLPQALVDAGAINSAAVSLWNGTALFGGVNKARYEGDLHTFDIVQGNSSRKALRINMDSISINGSSEASDEFPVATVFDVSSSWSYVPTSVFQALKAEIGVTNVSDELGMVNFSCNAVPNDTIIAFKFGDLDLEFDLSLFISRGDMFSVKPWIDLYTKGIDNDTCFFQILENKFDDWEGGGAILGSNIISLIYSVFDLDNEQILLAKRSENDDAADDIVEISSGKDGVPGAKDSNSAGTRVGGNMSMIALVAATAMLIIVF